MPEAQNVLADELVFASGKKTDDLIPNIIANARRLFYILAQGRSIIQTNRFEFLRRVSLF